MEESHCLHTLFPPSTELEWHEPCTPIQNAIVRPVLLRYLLDHGLVDLNATQPGYNTKLLQVICMVNGDSNEMCEVDPAPCASLLKGLEALGMNNSVTVIVVG